MKSSNWEDLKTTLKEKSTNKFHAELLLFLDVTRPQISIFLLDGWSYLFIDRFLQQPLEQGLHLQVVFWLLLKSNVYLGWKVHIIFFFVNIFDSLSCRYKWLCQFYLFEQRNLHRPNQWLQLQLPSRICRQPMRNWLDTCCCYWLYISAKRQHETPSNIKLMLDAVECWWLINMDQF